MPFTRPFSVSNIPGTTLAKQIDEEFRASKLELLERFNATLFVDFAADPLVLKDSLAGKVVGKQLLIPHNDFKERIGGPKRPEINELFTAIFEDTGTMQASVVLPPGVTITKVEFLVDRGQIDIIHWALDRLDFDLTPSKTAISLGDFSTAGVQIIDSGAIAHVVQNNSYYQLTLETTSSANVDSFLLYAARITYDTPSHLNTI